MLDYDLSGSFKQDLKLRVNPLWGRAKAFGSKLTLERFREMQREDAELENEMTNGSGGVATAVELSGHFVTSDHHELELIDQQEQVSFFWFR